MPPEVDAIGSLGRSVIARDDADIYLHAGLLITGQSFFEHPIGATIEVGVLREMVEAVARAIEADGDVMAAIVSNAAIRPPGSRKYNSKGEGGTAA